MAARAVYRQTGKLLPAGKVGELRPQRESGAQGYRRHPGDGGPFGLRQQQMSRHDGRGGQQESRVAEIGDELRDHPSDAAGAAGRGQAAAYGTVTAPMAEDDAARARHFEPFLNRSVPRRCRGGAERCHEAGGKPFLGMGRSDDLGGNAPPYPRHVLRNPEPI